MKVARHTGAIGAAAVFCLLGVAIGCMSPCTADVTGLCGRLLIASGQLEPVIVDREAREPLTLLVAHPSGPSNRTAVLVVHGTSRDTTGDAAAEADEFARRFGPMGYTVVSVAYREADSAYAQYDLEDTLDAIGWMISKGKELLDVDALILYGSSRGGIVAYNVAFTVGPEQLDGIIVRSGVSNFLLLAETPLPYVLGLYGPRIQQAAWETIEWLGGLPYGDPDPWASISAGFNIEQIAVPMLILHGTNDWLIPFNQATDFRDRVEAAGADHIEFYFAEGQGHFSIHLDPGSWAAIEDFLERHRATIPGDERDTLGGTTR